MPVAYVAMMPLKTALMLATLGRPLNNTPTRQAAVGGHWLRARPPGRPTAHPLGLSPLEAARPAASLLEAGRPADGDHPAAS